MNRLDGKLKRLWNSTHTFIRARDWKLIADYWKAPLDDANVKPEDFEAAYSDLRKKLNGIGQTNKDVVRAEIQKFADNNVLAYYAMMHEDTSEMARTYPRGYWVKNNAVGLLKTLHEVRQRAENLKDR